MVKPGDQVKRGDLLGRSGTSGSSPNPHLHIHATKSDLDSRKLKTKADVDAAVKAYAEDPKAHHKGPRPLLFDGVQTTLLANLKQGGPENTPTFGPVNNQGVYFDSYAITPGCAR